MAAGITGGGGGGTGSPTFGGGPALASGTVPSAAFALGDPVPAPANSATAAATKLGFVDDGSAATGSLATGVVTPASTELAALAGLAAAGTWAAALAAFASGFGATNVSGLIGVARLAGTTERALFPRSALPRSLGRGGSLGRGASRDSDLSSAPLSFVAAKGCAGVFSSESPTGADETTLAFDSSPRASPTRAPESSLEVPSDGLRVELGTVEAGTVEVDRVELDTVESGRAELGRAELSGGVATGTSAGGAADSGVDLGDGEDSLFASAEVMRLATG